MKLQNLAIITNEEIENGLNCSICGSVLEFTRNANDQYFTTHCDRDYVLNCVKYQAIITKNANMVKVTERKHLDHPDKVIEQKRYV